MHNLQEWSCILTGRRRRRWSLAVFIIFPKSRNTFQYPLSKRVCKRLPKRLSRVVAFIIELYREYESRGRPCHCAAALRMFYPWSRDHVGHPHLRRSVGDIKGVSKQLCVYHLYRNVFLAQTRIRSHFFRRFIKGVSNPLIKTALRLSFVKNLPWKSFGNLNSMPRLWSHNNAHGMDKENDLLHDWQ